jgi:hypothetical protein
MLIFGKKTAKLCRWCEKYGFKILALEENYISSSIGRLTTPVQVHKHRNLLARARVRLHYEITGDLQRHDLCGDEAICRSSQQLRLRPPFWNCASGVAPQPAGAVRSPQRTQCSRFLCRDGEAAVELIAARAGDAAARAGSGLGARKRCPAYCASFPRVGNRRSLG